MKSSAPEGEDQVVLSGSTTTTLEHKGGTVCAQRYGALRDSRLDLPLKTSNHFHQRIKQSGAVLLMLISHSFYSLAAHHLTPIAAM